MIPKNIYAIIVNWNGKDDTLVCLSSLKKIRKRRDIHLSLLVVDNGSTNDSVAVIRQKHPEVTVLETGENLGFTGGNNYGMRYALDRNADYVWLLNNDTIVDPHVLDLTDAFRGAVGVAGSKIYFASGHEYHRDRYSEKDRGRVLWYAGGSIDWANMYASHRGVDEVDAGQYDEASETDFITGCSMMISRGVLEKIGLLDDAYYLYYEDLDYCLRAKKAGFRLVYYPQSVLWHVNAGSSGGSGSPLHQYYQTRNRLLVGVRYASARTKIALFRESIRFLIHGSDIQKKAVCDALIGKWGKQYGT